MFWRVALSALVVFSASWAAPALAGPGDLTIRPARPVVATGGSVNLAVYAEQAAAGTRARVRNAVWTTNGGEVTGAGRFRADTPGTFTVRALYRGRSASVTVNVVAVATLVHRVEVVPAVAHTPPNVPVAARAYVYDRFGRRLQVPLRWRLPEGVTRDATGRIRAAVPGRYRVSVGVDGSKASGVLRLTVTSEPVAAR